jgi:hypothetical protein
MAAAFADLDFAAFAKLGREMLAEHRWAQPVTKTATKNATENPCAAGSTVEALMLSLRESGEAALAEPRCRQRLADLSTAQVREVIARLMRLRANQQEIFPPDRRYPAITDELLLRLGRQL